MALKYATVMAWTVSLAFLLVGYDFITPYSTESFLKEENNSTESQQKLNFTTNLNLTNCQHNWFVYTVDVYGVAGAIVAGSSANAIGRKNSIITAGALFFMGYLLMLSASNYPILMIGRVFTGIASGISLVIVPIYIAEASPSDSRACLTKCPEIFLCFGTLLGMILHHFFSKISKMLAWRLMMGVGLITSSLLSFGMMFLPESPTWYYMDHQIIKAVQVLRLTSDNNDDEVDSRREIMESTSEDIQPRIWADLFSPVSYNVSVSIVILHFCQQILGMEYMLQFSRSILTYVGLRKPILGGLVIMGFRIGFLILFTLLRIRIHRRLSLLVFVNIAGACLTLVGIAFLLSKNAVLGETTVVSLSSFSIVIFTIMYTIGIGPVTWTYGTEILPYNLRAKGVSIGVIANRITRALFLSLIPHIFLRLSTGGNFLTSAILLILGFIVCFKTYRESTIHILEEVDVTYGGRNELPPELL